MECSESINGWLLPDELNRKKKLFDEEFLNKNLLFAEKMFYQIQTNALKKVRQNHP